MITLDQLYHGAKFITQVGSVYILNRLPESKEWILIRSSDGITWTKASSKNPIDAFYGCEDAFTYLPSIP